MGHGWAIAGLVCTSGPLDRGDFPERGTGPVTSGGSGGTDTSDSKEGAINVDRRRWGTSLRASSNCTNFASSSVKDARPVTLTEPFVDVVVTCPTLLKARRSSIPLASPGTKMRSFKCGAAAADNGGNDFNGAGPVGAGLAKMVDFLRSSNPRSASNAALAGSAALGLFAEGLRSGLGRILFLLEPFSKSSSSDCESTSNDSSTKLEPNTKFFVGAEILNGSISHNFFAAIDSCNHLISRICRSSSLILLNLAVAIDPDNAVLQLRA